MKFRIESHWHVEFGNGSEMIAIGTAEQVMRDIACAAQREGVALIATRTETEIVARANGKPFVLAELCVDPCMESKPRGKGRK